MKTLTRIYAIIMAMVLALFSTGTVALAAEPTNEANIIESNIVDVTYNDDGSKETTYEFEITPDKVNENGIALLSADVDQTFTITAPYRGSSRTYAGNKLNVSVSATDANGNAVNTILAVQLCDHNSGESLREIQCSANGQPSHLYNYDIISGKLYYFQYLIAYGSQRTVRIHMVVTSHN